MILCEKRKKFQALILVLVSGSQFLWWEKEEKRQERWGLAVVPVWSARPYLDDSGIKGGKRDKTFTWGHTQHAQPNNHALNRAPQLGLTGSLVFDTRGEEGLRESATHQLEGGSKSRITTYYCAVGVVV
jgi:hypothetical protein